MSVHLPPSFLKTRELTHHFGFSDSYVWVHERSPRNAGGSYPLMFIHGRMGHSPIWAPLMRHLCSERKCTTLDLPGFGRSFVASGRGLSFSEHVALLSKVVDHVAASSGLPLERVILIGHDLGGALAQAVSILRPERVAAIVLINSACLMEELPVFSGRLVRKALRKVRSRISPLYEFSVRSVQESSGTHMRSALRALHESWPGEFQRRQWGREIAASRHPVLLVWGGENVFHPVTTAFRLMQTLDDAYFTELDSCSHWPSLEVPALLAWKIREFLFRIGASVGPASPLVRRTGT